MSTLHLVNTTLSGDIETPVAVGRGYNLGYTIRDSAKMQEHIDEVELLGVFPPVPTQPPLIFGIAPFAWSTSTEVFVQGPETSGEVEIFVIDDGQRLLVGVGSDHTDRELEAHNIPRSKQVCQNIVAPAVWPWGEVAGHWDECILESFVTSGGDTRPYQKASVSEFWQPDEIASSLSGRVPEIFPRVILSGTVVSLGKSIVFGEAWSFRLTDPVLDRTIEHSYRVTVLEAELR